jgi:3-phosphoshikimate 1-carboxyvinyltransferase
MKISPAKRISGGLTMPGDKSISHRAALFAAVAQGRSRITNYSTSQDCAATLTCLQNLGVRVDQRGADVLIDGAGTNGLRVPNSELDCGNSGTTMRLLAGILAGQSFVSTLTGDESLRSRPMQRVAEPLRMMGARVSLVDGRAPLTIEGSRSLTAIDYELLIASAQVKSCVLLAALKAKGKTTVTENEVTRDHTERMLKWFGAPIETGRKGEHGRFATVTGPAELSARDFSIPGDVSSAAYFIAAAAMLPQSTLQISDVGLNPTRVAFLKHLGAFGSIEVTDPREQANEPAGTVHVCGATQGRTSKQHEPAVKIEGLEIPQLIDELPLLAVVGSQIRQGLEIRDARELRAKESDRIAATVQNLRAMGAEVEEFEDGLRVSGGHKLRGATIDPRGDHPIAMAFSVAALVADGDCEIKDAECVGVSFPEFYDLLHSVAER